MIQKYYQLYIAYKYEEIERKAQIAYKTIEGAKREMKRQYELFIKEYNIVLDKSTHITIKDNVIYLFCHAAVRFYFDAFVCEDIRYPIHEDDDEITELGGTLFRIAEDPNTIISITNELYKSDFAYKVLQGECTSLENKTIAKLSYEEEVEFLNKQN